MNANKLSPELKRSTQEIIRCYKKLSEENSNIVKALITPHDPFYQWEHYPPNDAQDQSTLCQYYYHSHPGSDCDRLNEHGHFHLFIREPAIPHHLKPIYTSLKYQQDQSDNLCHLVAISMNNKGLPIGLFTVNHWVAQGLWYDANSMAELIDLFHIEMSYPNETINHWLNAMITLFNPTIKTLFEKRDEVLNAMKTKHPEKNVFTNKDLEITSLAILPKK